MTWQSHLKAVSKQTGLSGPALFKEAKKTYRSGAAAPKRRPVRRQGKGLLRDMMLGGVTYARRRPVQRQGKGLFKDVLQGGLKLAKPHLAGLASKGIDYAAGRIGSKYGAKYGDVARNLGNAGLSAARSKYGFGKPKRRAPVRRGRGLLDTLRKGITIAAPFLKPILRPLAQQGINMAANAASRRFGNAGGDVVRNLGSKGLDLAAQQGYGRRRHRHHVRRQGHGLYNRI